MFHLIEKRKKVYWEDIKRFKSVLIPILKETYPYKNSTCVITDGTDYFSLANFYSANRDVLITVDRYGYPFESKDTFDCTQGNGITFRDMNKSEQERSLQLQKCQAFAIGGLRGDGARKGFITALLNATEAFQRESGTDNMSELTKTA